MRAPVKRAKPVAKTTIKPKKYQRGGSVRARGDDEGRAREDVEEEQYLRAARDAEREHYDIARHPGLRGAALLRNWEANRRAGQAGRAAGLYENSDTETKDSASELDRARQRRNEIERDPFTKKPAPYKKGGRVTAKKKTKK